MPDTRCCHPKHVGNLDSGQCECGEYVVKIHSNPATVSLRKHYENWTWVDDLALARWMLSWRGDVI